MYMRVSQEAGRVVRYSQLIKKFPQCAVIHTVEDFSIVNEAEVDVFLEFFCFFYYPKDFGNLISGSSDFSKSSLNYCKFSVQACWSLAWRILSITSQTCEMSAVVQWFEHSLNSSSKKVNYLLGTSKKNYTYPINIKFKNM